jgi:hypothetical protein
MAVSNQELRDMAFKVTSVLLEENVHTWKKRWLAITLLGLLTKDML